MRSLLLILAACNAPRTYTLEELPVEEWTGGLPVTGDGKLFVALRPRTPTDWSKVQGLVVFQCDDCMLGGERSKLHLEDIGDVDFGSLTFGTIRARIEFGDGRVRLTTQWRSPDFTLDADVDAILAPRSEDIQIAGCVVFRPEQPLLARDPKLHALLSITGAPLGEDDRYYITLAGTLGAMRRLGKICAL